MKLENLSDFDSIAINLALNGESQQINIDPFIYLEDFVIDLTNLVAFKKNCIDGGAFKLVKTESNDRTRSRLNNRKPFDLTAAFQPAHSSIFDKKYAEFARMWAIECNGGNKEMDWLDKSRFPTPRQVFVGVW